MNRFASPKNVAVRSRATAANGLTVDRRTTQVA